MKERIDGNKKERKEVNFDEKIFQGKTFLLW